MAKLNLNAVLCNERVNDNVVTGRMAIGSQLAMQATAILSHGPQMPEPYGVHAPALAGGDAGATRIGRSVSPAGCSRREDLGLRARSALALSKRQSHAWHGFNASLVASATTRIG